MSYADGGESDILVNENFDNGNFISPWVIQPDTQVTFENNRLKVDYNLAYKGIFVPITVEQGKSYSVSFDVDVSQLDGKLQHLVTYNDGGQFPVEYNETEINTGSYIFSFNAQISGTYYITFRPWQLNSSSSVNIDNIIVSENAILEIREENNYYPFGLKHKEYNSVVNGVQNKLLTYVGKEQNESLDYNMLEMDWRHFDPAIGRFVGIDAMADSFEDYTPYHYSNNSPIMYKDPSDLFSTVVNEDGEIIDHKDDGDIGIYLNERGEDNLIGYETEGRDYNVGEHIYGDDIFQDANVPSGFIVRLSPEFDKINQLELPLLVQLLTPGGGFKSVKLGYFARIKVLFNGGKATIIVRNLANVDKTTGLIKLLRAAEREAKTNGVTTLVIEGVEVLNTKLLSPKAITAFERLGYTIENLADDAIRLVKKL